MKEARLIVPAMDNHKRPSDATLAAVRDALARKFGGYTETTGRGGWIAPSGVPYHEPVHIFDVAADDSEVTRMQFRALATMVRRRLDQEAVYVRYASGDVDFIAEDGRKVAA